jgi:hypothetical protein
VGASSARKARVVVAAIALLVACDGGSQLGPAATAGSGSSGSGSGASGADASSTSGWGAGDLDGPASDDASLISDAGPADALAATDSAGQADAGDAAPCVTSGTELCDGFENGKLDGTLWKTVTNGPSPSIKVDSMHAHTGQYAVHLTVTPGQQSAAQITENVTFPAASDTFYTRIWAYVSPGVMWPDSPPDFHTGFIIASGNNDLGHVDLAVGANLSPSSAAGPMHYLGYSIYRGPPYDEFGPRSSTEVANEAWTCIELLESGKGGSAAVRRIWVDGKELPEQYDTFDGQAPPQFDIVSIGIWEYHPTPSLSDMWIDDVRVSSQRIGCGN